ncbi:MAG: hypothetical protein HQM12_13775 [SAR324 cluster bacterium]|nr:hypothetical protein [SAR324 cluster bacterium]
MSVIQEFQRAVQEYWQSIETRNVWNDWIKLLYNLGCDLKFNRPETVRPDEKIKFVVFLEAVSPILRNHPIWLKQLTSPKWLHAHNIFVMAFGNAVAESPKPRDNQEDAVQILRSSIQDLTNKFERLQQRVVQIEQRSVPQTPFDEFDRPEPLRRETPSLPLRTADSSFLKQAQLMQKELTIRQLTKPAKSSVAQMEAPKNSVEAVEKAYLPYNEWLNLLAQDGTDLQQLSNEPLQVASSHRISFEQFGHRVARKITDPEKLQIFLNNFIDRHPDGIEVPQINYDTETTQPAETVISAPSQASAGFVPPSVDTYNDFQAWVQWLRQAGIDLKQFTSRDFDDVNSHRISFQQFCRRVERYLDDVPGFRTALGLTTP